MFKIKITHNGKRFKTLQSKEKNTALDKYYKAINDYPFNDMYRVQLVHFESGEIIAGESVVSIGIKTAPNTYKIFKAGIKREQGWLYYLDKDCNIARSRLMNRRNPKYKGPHREVLYITNVVREENFLYFIDRQGDVSCTKMVRGRSPGRIRSS